MRAHAIFAAVAAYFLAGLSLGFALGAARTVLLEPRIGALGATLLELPVILSALWWAAALIARRVGLSRNEGAAAGVIWFAAFLVSEFALGGLLRGWNPAQSLAHLQSPPGALGLIGFAIAASFPGLAASRKARREGT